MPLAARDVMPLVLAAVPSFREKWDQEVREYWMDEESPGGRLGYMDAGEVVRHAVDLLTTGQRAEVAALFAVVERLHLEGDDYVQELATIGYLEDFQNALDRHPALTHDDVLLLLGKESRKWWRAVERFWAGESPAVRLEKHRRKAARKRPSSEG
jgi:hypothetical protein